MQTTETINPAENDRTYHVASVAEEAPTEDVQNESTPLLPAARRRRSIESRLAPVFVTAMLLIFMAGIFISVYLLFIEDEEWSVDIGGNVINRKTWGARRPKSTQRLNTTSAEYVILSHTDTSECVYLDSCRPVLQQFQDLCQGPPYYRSDLPFNFLINSGGETYEGVGYDRVGDVDQSIDDVSISIGFIGNYVKKTPSNVQFGQLHRLIKESIKNEKLASNYRLVVRSYRGYPMGINASMSL